MSVSPKRPLHTLHQPPVSALSRKPGAVQGDHDRVARRGEVGAVVEWDGAGTVDEGATVDEDHDWQPLGPPLDCGARRPDVEEQTVLRVAGDTILRADRTKRGGGTDMVPARIRLRWSPAPLSDRRQRIGDAAITVESTAGLGRCLDRQPADLAGRGVDCTDAGLRRGRRHGQAAADHPDRQGKPEAAHCPRRSPCSQHSPPSRHRSTPADSPRGPAPQVQRGQPVCQAETASRTSAVRRSRRRSNSREGAARSRGTSARGTSLSRSFATSMAPSAGCTASSGCRPRS